MSKKEFSETTEFRYGVPLDLYADWRSTQQRVGLPQTQILHRLVRFLLEQDEVMQGLILGTLTPKDDLAALVLGRLKQKASSPPVEFDREQGILNPQAGSKQADAAKPGKRR